MSLVVVKTSWHEFYKPLINRAFDTLEDIDVIISELRTGQSEFWTLKDGTTVRGHVVTRLEIWPDHKEFVIVAIQGTGILRRPFFEAMCDIARVNGADRLRVHEINERVKLATKRLGFIRCDNGHSEFILNG